MVIFPLLPADLMIRLQAVEMQAKGVEGYFDLDACTYPEGLRIYLRRMMENVGGGRDVGAVLFPDDAPEVDKIDTILGEIESTIAEMRMLEKKLGGEATDSSDKIAFYRAKTALIERWANTKERIYNLKEMSEF